VYSYIPQNDLFGQQWTTHTAVVAEQYNEAEKFLLSGNTVAIDGAVNKPPTLPVLRQ
jgi:hypothetical protein